MKFALNILYLLMLIVLAPWIAWRIVVQQKNRRGLAAKLFGYVPRRSSARRCVWIHAVSVGEVNLLVPFVAAFRRQYPDYDVAISTTTETGYDLAKKRFADDFVFFCPSDFSWAINNTIRRLKPAMLLLTELELWPNLISVTSDRNIPVALINGRISGKSFNGYMKLRIVVKHVIRKLDIAIVQTELYADRLRSLGMCPDKVHVCGNMKFDGVKISSDFSKARSLASAANISNNEIVFLAGSTQENEDLMAISVYEQLKHDYPQLRLILVPRHPSRCHRIDSLLRKKNIPFVRRSKISKSVNQLSPVLIVDVIGELGDWWARADVGYVGGSMGSRGGQNMIEPAAYGVPISFGPNTENFKDIVELLLNECAATVVKNELEMKQFVFDVLENRELASELGERGKVLVATQNGATARTLHCLRALLRPVANIDSPTQFRAA